MSLVGFRALRPQISHMHDPERKPAGIVLEDRALRLHPAGGAGDVRTSGTLVPVRGERAPRGVSPGTIVW